MNDAHNEYWGLPSNPLSIYHTGVAWLLPNDPRAQHAPKEARPVCTHEMAPMWRELGERIYKYFDSVELKWTSIDPVRFTEAELELGPLFLWVGVLPGTLSHSAAKVAAARCKTIISEYKIATVEIAFRESIFTRSVGLQPLDHVPPSDPTFNLRGPFTPTLGLQIAPRAHPYFAGTGCLYLCEGGESDRVFLLAARHVALPPSKYSNSLYHRKNTSIPRRDIIHLGAQAYQTAVTAIDRQILCQDLLIAIANSKGRLEDSGEAVVGEDPGAELLGDRLSEAESSKKKMCDLRSECYPWCIERDRVLGHIVYSPPISVHAGDKMCTEDWALIELNRTKFDRDIFRGNVIRLVSKLTAPDFMRKMYPDIETRAKYEYPQDGLMQLRGIVKEGELRHLTLLDKNGEGCIIAVKNGTATGVTLGRVSGLESFVREYKDSAIHATSMEIAVHSYSYEDGAFSAPGDSGAVVADAHSRIVGMIIGGAGKADLIDVTYVSPYYFLDERIKTVFPDSYLYEPPDFIAHPIAT